MLPSKDALERIKLSFGIIVGSLLFVTLISILLWPGRMIGGIVKHLHASGIEVQKFNIMGIEAKLLMAAERVQDAASVTRAELDATKNRLVEAQSLLRCLKAASCSPTEQAKIAEALSLSASSTPGFEAARQELDAAIRDVRQATSSLAPTPSAASAGARSWIAIAGADKDLSAAQYEVRKLETAGVPGRQIAVLLQDGWYRTVVFFSSRSEADDAATMIAKILGRQPYSREFNRWCPNAVEAEGKFIRCGAPAAR